MIHFFLKGWENVLFQLGRERVNQTTGSLPWCRLASKICSMAPLPVCGSLTASGTANQMHSRTKLFMTQSSCYKKSTSMLFAPCSKIKPRFSFLGWGFQSPIRPNPGLVKFFISFSDPATSTRNFRFNSRGFG